MEASVVRVGNKDKTTLGTGFVVDKYDGGAYVATCGHVVDRCAGDVYVDGQLSEVITNRYCQGLDLSILKVEGLDLEPLQVSKSGAISSSGDVIGYSKFMDGEKKERIREVSIKVGVELTKKDDTRVHALGLRSNDNIGEGYSGSPVICGISGSVVGVVNIKSKEGSNYAICSSHLHDIHTIDTSIYEPSIYNKKRLSVSSDVLDKMVNLFKFELDKTLKSFSTQTNIFISPRLYKGKEEESFKAGEDIFVLADELLENPRSLIVESPQQYGLTSLSKYLVLKSVSGELPSFWLYLDAAKLKPYKKEIQAYVKRELSTLNVSESDIECVIVDEFSSGISEPVKVLEAVSDYFSSTPLVVMKTMLDNPLVDDSFDFDGVRKFDHYFLWGLHRSEIRSVVTAYNEQHYIGEEESVLNRVITDLEVLNIPRTTLNCMTMLKIYEVEFDESPVNRTEMIRRVLYLLFNVDDVPHYKVRPDLKDTEFVLGFFCEKIIRSNEYYFTRLSFIVYWKS